jgi:hypothetical protein
MGKNLNVSLNKPAKKVECQDPEHEGDRSNNSGDLWMEFPDFIFRCDACHERREKLNNIARKNNESISQEQLEFLG